MTEMDCGRSRELLCACVDEELDRDQAVSVLHHLRQCPSCEELYHVQRTVKSLLHRTCGQETAPVGLRERVWAAVVEQCHLPAETSVTVNTTHATFSTTTSDGVLVRRATFTGTVVRATYRSPLGPDTSRDQQP